MGFSKATISAVTDKILPMLQECKIRPLEEVYPFLFLDAIYYKVREDGQYISKVFYTVLGVRLDGKKEILGLYLGESEGAKFWLQVLTRAFRISCQPPIVVEIISYIRAYELHPLYQPNEKTRNDLNEIKSFIIKYF